MLVLFETPMGYALFKLQDKGVLEAVDKIHSKFATSESAANIVKLKHFKKFDDTTAALSAATSLIDNKLDPGLEAFLKEKVGSEKGKLAVGDTKLGNLIKESLGIKCKAGEAVEELHRGIRMQLESLIGGISDTDKHAMRLGLSHSLCRYKLKFSPDKVDTMIVQAIALLDELDKELNTYAMRVREWYGWHFPEMGKIVTDNIQYAKAVIKMGVRTNALNIDFSDILEEEVEEEIKAAAKVSMGTEISTEDTDNINELCQQVVEISDYRGSLFEYLQNRMRAIAPNLSVMVGELVGARLIAHAGSLLNLAKHPASTVQILGAEKALFRALKTKHETPKYGLIYHASLVGQAAPKFKGKISRVLAAKTALSIRQDALGDAEGVTIGTAARLRVEQRLQELEGGVVNRISSSSKSKATPKKYQAPTESKSYNDATDAVMNGADEAKDKKEKKKKKRKRDDEEETPAPAAAPAAAAAVSEEDTKEAKKAKKRAKKAAAAAAEAAAAAAQADAAAVAAANAAVAAATPEKKKKKKKKKDKMEE